MSTTMIIVLVVIVGIIAVIAATQGSGPKVTVIKTESEDEKGDDA